MRDHYSNSLSDETLDEVHVAFISPPDDDSQTGTMMRTALQKTRSNPHFYWHILYFQEDLGAYYKEVLPGQHIKPVVAIVDLVPRYSKPKQIIQDIFEIREQFPFVVFVLYIARPEHDLHRADLPAKWLERLDHYYKIYGEQFAHTTTLDEVLHISEVLAKKKAEESQGKITEAHTIFISYSRRDLDFALELVNHLTDKGFTTWFDQQSIVGGDDWMQSISKGLDQSKLAIVVDTPDALQSKYVQMEYRTFIKRGKPIIPLIHKSIGSIPIELQRFQYVDCTTIQPEIAYEQLENALRQHFKSHNSRSTHRYIISLIRSLRRYLP